MLGLPPITVPCDQPAATASRALIERQTAKLERLSEIGMEIAEAAGQRARALAEGDPADATTTDPGLSFARAARAVRLTIALQSRLAEALAALERGEAMARVGEAARRRGRIQRLVEDAAEAEGCERAEVERRSSEVWERLTDADDDEVLDCPIEAVVARICRDLGVPFDETVWTGPPAPVLGQGQRRPRDLVPPNTAPAREALAEDWPPRSSTACNPRLQREQRANRNEPGTAISERVRQ